MLIPHAHLAAFAGAQRPLILAVLESAVTRALPHADDIHGVEGVEQARQTTPNVPAKLGQVYKHAWWQGCEHWVGTGNIGVAKD